MVSPPQYRSLVRGREPKQSESDKARSGFGDFQVMIKIPLIFQESAVLF